MALGLLQPGGAQYVQASGESTPQGKLPDQFKSTNVAPSPLSSQQRVPPDWIPPNSARRSMVVERAPRMVGMRTLYSRQVQRQPYERVGQPGGQPPRPYISGYQPNNRGPIRNGHFNDALYQAGYPGFNLGLSFKVPTIQAPSGSRIRGQMSRGGPGKRTNTQKAGRSPGGPAL